MKIIQMNLDDFGIYHNVEWNPPETGLIVMHGHNESGKTTLMKYVRSMFFGYLRGDWKGFFGHMDIRRDDGREYRIYRKEKESYMTDGQLTLHDEPADLWWHGLDRQTYDKIFAMGLEDLQGFKILSNETVRSQFFSVEGGVRMGATRRDIIRQMGDLLVASPQGKKPINALLAEQREFDNRIRALSYDEDEFAQLQGKEQATHETENRIRLSIEETKQQIERISMPIAAWDVYKRGQDALKRMQNLADVSQFPADGAQKWTELETKIGEIDEQIRKLEALSAKGPAFREEWNSWLLCGPHLDDLYLHVGEWKQGLEEVAAHADMEIDWQFEQNQCAESLKPWTGDTIPASVDWTGGQAAAAGLARCEQELEKWQAAKPKNVAADKAEAPAEGEPSKEEWQAVGKAVSSIQECLMERKKLREQLQWLKSDGSGVSHGPAVLAVLCLAAAAGLAAMVFVYGMDQLFGYGAGLFLALAVAAFAKQKSLAGKGPRRIEELEKSLAAVQERMEALAAEAKAGLAASDDDDVWSRKLDEIRMQYMDWKTQESKTVWEKEQKVMYDAIYDEWNKKGAAWQGKLEASRKAWESWRGSSGFASLEVGQLAQAKEVWDKWHAAVSAAESWRVRKEDLLRRMGQWRDSAEQLFRELGVAGEGTPEQTEAVYKQWQTIRVQAEVAREQDKQQQERQAQIVQLQKDKEIRQSQQQDLLVLTGAQTTGEFRSKVLKFRQFQQYKEVYEQSEAHIRLIAKTPKQLAELRHELKVHTLKNWTDEREYYEKKIADAEKKLAEVAEKRGSIIERLSQMARSDAYGQLLQEKQNRKAELDGKVNEWLTYLFAQYMLGEAQSYYERVRQPLVIRQAGDYLHLMTQGRYTLQASFDGRQLYAVDGTQRRIPEKQWSSGLGDQIYLAIRISLAMAFSKQIEAMPLILDDILVRFDEQRQKEAIHFLADLGKKEQIFLFTCSQTTRNLAGEVQKELAGETDTIHLFEIEQGTIRQSV
ncbi:AAA family ATPase [uncultured Megasphaera sp.]|uniref:AAA family ATPase n=1 Tax=uncultured Megasphaera sp. TaxID=165188 RepID=UPI002593F9FC|nr:AAA family ATPase [uncultured Megasphaera sp.]